MMAEHCSQAKAGVYRTTSSTIWVHSNMPSLTGAHKSAHSNCSLTQLQNTVSSILYVARLYPGVSVCIYITVLVYRPFYFLIHSAVPFMSPGCLTAHAPGLRLWGIMPKTWALGDTAPDMIMVCLGSSMGGQRSLFSPLRA